MVAMYFERMERKGAAAGPPVICWAHTCRVWAGVKQPITGHLVPIRQLSSTRGPLSRLKEQRKAEAGAPPC